MLGKKKNSGSVLYSYRESTVSGRGVAAIILAVLSTLILAVLTSICMFAPALSGEWLGAVGAGAFVLAFIGLLEGYSSFRDNCKSYLPSRIGTIYSALMVAAWFLLFCYGLAH